MLAMFVEMLPTIIGAAIVFGIVGMVIYRGFRNHKAGKHSCSCGGACGGCPASSLCHPQKK